MINCYCEYVGCGSDYGSMVKEIFNNCEDFVFIVVEGVN